MMNIITPIHVEALRVSPHSPDTVFDALYDFTKLGQNPLASQSEGLIAAKNFGGSFSTPDPGIHLHWSLPKAYTRGVQNNKTGEIAFPMLPNRWLVTRWYRQAGAANGSIAMWLLESDAYGAVEANDPNATPIPIPVSQDQESLFDLSHALMGHLIDLKKDIWEEGQGEASISYLQDNLQALLAYGETFTAYYKNSGGALGFYDSLHDLSLNLQNVEFSVSYSVMGWVSDPAKDILTLSLADYDPQKDKDFGAYTKGVFEQKLEWKLDDYSGITAANYQAVQAVPSGLVAGIGWCQDGATEAYPTKTPDGSHLTVTLGGNTAEAISAYISGVDHAEAEDGTDLGMEWLLNAFQYGQLQNLASGAVGVGQLDEYMHTRSFSPQHGGMLWSVRPPETKGANGENVQEATLSLTLAKLLSQLNLYQQQWDQQRDEIASRQKKLFFDWSYHVNALNSNVFSQPPKGQFQDDKTGAYLLAGLLELFPLFAEAGAYQPTATPISFPYSYHPDGFSFETPDQNIPSLSSYNFNRGANAAAEATLERILNWQYNLETTLPAGISALTQSLKTAQLLLNAYDPSGSNATQYAEQITHLLTQAQTLAAQLAQSLELLEQVDQGIAALNTTLTKNIQNLQKLWNGDSSTGDFKTWFDITSQGLDHFPYAGQSAGLPQWLNVLSWPKRGDFPGIGAALNQLTEAGADDVIDTQLAAVHLAQAYVWGHSSAEGNAYAASFAIETAQATLAQAASNAQDALTALQTITGAAAARQALQQALTSLGAKSGSGALQTIMNEVAAGNKQLALQSLASLLTEHTLPTPSLPAMETAVTSANWLSQIQALETCWAKIAAQLPSAHVVYIVGQFLYGKVQDNYQLTQVPAPSYYQPTEPVLVLGEGLAEDRILKPVNRNGRAKLLPCRLPSELVQYGSATYPPAIGNLGNRVKPHITNLVTTLQTLLQEAYLLTPEYYKTGISILNLAKMADAEETAQKPLFHDVKLMKVADYDHGILPYTGKLPYFIAYNYWQPTSGSVTQSPVYEDVYLPLFIYWQANYRYSQHYDGNNEQYPKNYLTELFDFDSYQVDYQPTAPASFEKSATLPNEINVSGVISLSSAATANFQNQIRTFCQQNLNNYDPAAGPPNKAASDYQEKQELYEAYTAFNNWSVLSQGLSGFNIGLLQQIQELQLPLNIPSTWLDGGSRTSPSATRFWVTKFLQSQSASWRPSWAADGVNFAAFDVSDDKVFYLPIRGGFLQMLDIHLVDVFGRNIKLDNPQPTYVADSLRTANQEYPDSNHHVYLPPRLQQPSRLNFNWVSAEAPDGMGPFVEFNPHPAASPICGWLLPNHLDDTLLLYDRNGHPLGEAGRQGSAGGQSNVYLYPVPGSTEVDVAGIDNLVLRDFITNFVKPGADFAPFQGFLNVVDDSQQFIISSAMQQKKDLAVLMGRPLVLAQAEIQLSLQGLPDVSLDTNSAHPTFIPWSGSNQAFELDNSTKKGYIPYRFSHFNDGNVTNLEVPVLLGDPQIKSAGPGGQSLPYFDDGLVGYFLPGDPTFYTPLELAHDISGITSTYGLTAAEMPLQLTVNGPPVRLTMVIDPRVAIRATTAILPVTSIQIPPDQYQQIVRKLMMYFLSAPILTYQPGTEMTFSLNLPDEKGYDWYWYQIGGHDEPIEKPQHNANALFPLNAKQHLIDGWLKLKRSPLGS